MCERLGTAVVGATAKGWPVDAAAGSRFAGGTTCGSNCEPAVWTCGGVVFSESR